MRSRFPLLLVLAAGCVSVQPPPNPRGAVRQHQRLVVCTYQSPGPWIVADPDSKAESALKILPLGGLLQSFQEDRINDFSKELQPYLPRPHYASAYQEALIAALKKLHDGPVITAAEAGMASEQLLAWNAAADQLDWRRRYFTPNGERSPRDYSKDLSLDDAVIVDTNLSFGLEPDETDRTLPTLHAATRVYHGDTGRLAAAREDMLSDKTSSATVTEFRMTPSDLTDRLYALAKPFGEKVATELAKELALVRPYAPPPVRVISTTTAPGGVVPLAPSTGPALGTFGAWTPPVGSTATAIGTTPAASTATTVGTPPTLSTVAVPASAPPPAAAPAVSTAAASAPPPPAAPPALAPETSTGVAMPPPTIAPQAR